jgi:hypothetical protein
MANRYKTGPFMVKKMDSLGWDAEEMSKRTGRALSYVQHIAKGNFPLNRAFCDAIDQATGKPLGKTWVELQEAGQ